MNDIEAAAVDDAFYKRWCSMAHLPNESQSDARRWFRAGAALAHAARGEGEEAEVHRQLDEATRIVKPYYNATGAFVGGPGNWIAPVHACPKCGKSLNWREFGGGIVADCACGRQTSYLFHPTPPPATGEAGARGEPFGGYERERAAFDEWWADKSDEYKRATGKGASLYGVAFDAYYARAISALPASRDASNPGEKEAR